MILGLALFFGGASQASAQEADQGEHELKTEKHGPGASDFHFSGGPGWSHDSALGDVVTQSLGVGYRLGPFEPGLAGDVGTMLNGSYFMLGASAGAVLQTESGVRLTTAAVFGADLYSSVGCGLFCKSGGASATLPYAGGRASVSYVFGSRSRKHLELGVMGFYGRDLTKETVSYSIRGGLLDSNSVSTGQRTLGGERVGAVFVVGITLDSPAKKSTETARR